MKKKCDKNKTVMILIPASYNDIDELESYLNKMRMSSFIYSTSYKKKRKDYQTELAAFAACLESVHTVLMPDDTGIIDWWLSSRGIDGYLKEIEKAKIPCLEFKCYWGGAFDDTLKFRAVPDDILEEILKFQNKGSELSILGLEGLKKLGFHNDRNYRKRLRQELNFISDQALEKHFLAMRQLLNLKKGRIFVMRYSSIPFGGYLLSYALGIIDFNALLNGLVFERGISPRAPMEIHLDIHPDDRNELENFVRDLEILSGIKVEFHENSPDYAIRCRLALLIDSKMAPSFSDIPFNDAKTMETIVQTAELPSFIEPFVQNILTLIEPPEEMPSFVEPFFRNILRHLKPLNFNELLLAFSMCPIRRWISAEYYLQHRDQSNIERLNEDVQEILNETAGILNYDEQTIRLVERIGGFTREAANKLRRDIGKRISHRIEEAQDKFLTHAIRNQRCGYREAQSIFDTILATRDCCTTSKAYVLPHALLFYRLMYLKTHHQTAYEMVFAANH